jgi:hypothetical protein
MDLDQRSPARQDRGGGASTIDEFCAAHKISRATFYNLLKIGKAPRVMVVMRRRLISDESAAAWRRQMEINQATAA